MQALRTLPILNRPSRPSSPIPAAAQVSNANAVGLNAAPGIDTAKPRSRSLSKQVTEKVAAMHLNGVDDGHGTPILTQSQPLGKKMSPPNSRPVTPGLAADAAAGGGGHMDAILLRLNETVNRALAGADSKTKRAVQREAGWAVGNGVVKELPSPSSDPYVLRAILRVATRALSIYINRLEMLLLPAITDPAFGQTMNLRVGATQPLNPTQLFALSVAHAAWETCEAFEDTLATGRWPKFVSDTLRPLMDKLDNTWGKVIQPLLMLLKKDLIGALARTEGSSPTGGKVVGLASVAAPPAGPLPDVKLSKEASVSSSGRSRLTKEISQPGQPRQVQIPTCFQQFANRVDGAHRALDLIARTCKQDGEGWVTGVIVPVVWKGMTLVAGLDHHTSGGPPSPGQVTKAILNNVNGHGHITKEGAVTPMPSAPVGVASKFSNSLSILPSRAASRPPSPPRSKVDPRVQAIMSFEGLVRRLFGTLVPVLPDPDPVDTVPAAERTVTREALREAVEALVSFRTVLSVMSGPHGSSLILRSAIRVREDKAGNPEEEKLDDALEDMPAVVLFKVLRETANSSLAKLGSFNPDLRVRHPAEVWGMTRQEFETKVLASFSLADEWALRVVNAIKGDVEKVRVALDMMMKEGGSEAVREASVWVNALGCAIEARAEVDVAGMP